MVEQKESSMLSTTFRLNKPVSLVVILQDDFRCDQPLMGIVNVTLEKSLKNAQRNLSGYYVFTDLDEGEYNLCVDSQYYFFHSEKILITKSEHTVLNIRLKPNVQYPFEGSATLFRGTAAAHEEVRASVVSPVATITQNIKAGDNIITIVGNWGRVLERDTLKIGNEYCTVIRIEGETVFKKLFLEEQIANDYTQGTDVIYTVSTLVDDNGEVVVYFRHAPDRIFQVLMEVGGSVNMVELIEENTVFKKI